MLASPSVCIDKVRQASFCIRQELSDDPLPESYVHAQTLASEFPNPTQDIELHCNSTVGQICVGAAYKHMASGALSPHAVLPLSFPDDRINSAAIDDTSRSLISIVFTQLGTD